MIGIFNGRSFHSSGHKDVAWIQMDTQMLKHMHLFQPSDWMVLCCLAMHVGSTNVCWPSLAKLATETGLSEQTVKAAIKRLSVVKIDGHRVLIVSDRHTPSGRQTSNMYVVMPSDEQLDQFEGEGRGIEITPQEGDKNHTPHYIEQETEGTISPISPQRGQRKGVQLPKDDDPALPLFLAWRNEIFPFAEAYTLAEWRKAHHVLRQMVHRGVTPGQVMLASRTLAGKWREREMVTINALWSHWTAATAPTLPKAMIAVRQVSQGATTALRLAKGLDK
jgi:hypothetical protein